MKDTSTIKGKVARLYTTLVSTTCRAVSGAAVLLCAILTVLLGYPRHRGLFSLGVESLICGGIFAGLIGVMGSRTMGFLSDKMLGRTVDIGLKSYFWMGCIFTGAGVIFLLAGFIIKWKDQKRIDVKYNLSHTCYIYILFIHSVTLLYQTFRILHYKNLLLIYIYPFLIFQKERDIRM